MGHITAKTRKAVIEAALELRNPDYVELRKLAEISPQELARDDVFATRWEEIRIERDGLEQLPDQELITELQIRFSDLDILRGKADQRLVRELLDRALAEIRGR